MSTIHQVGWRYKRVKKYHYNALHSFNNCPQRQGIVVKLRIVSPKKPNSAKRRVARVKLSNGYMVTARIVGKGHNLQPYSTVLVRGGRANDLPGVRYTLTKGALDFNWREDFTRIKRRSQYGIPKER